MTWEDQLCSYIYIYIILKTVRIFYISMFDTMYIFIFTNIVFELKLNNYLYNIKDIFYEKLLLILEIMRVYCKNIFTLRVYWYMYILYT